MFWEGSPEEIFSRKGNQNKQLGISEIFWEVGEVWGSKEICQRTGLYLEVRGSPKDLQGVKDRELERTREFTLEVNVKIYSCIILVF